MRCDIAPTPRWLIFGVQQRQLMRPDGGRILFGDDDVTSVPPHQRETGIPVGETGVELTLLTRDAAHCGEILANLARWGYPAERLS